AIFSVVSIAYIATGGVKAIVWTNVFQALVFLVAGAVTVLFVVGRVDGGVGAIVALAGEAGRLNVINWGPAPGAPDFWRRILTDPNIVRGHSERHYLFVSRVSVIVFGVILAVIAYAFSFFSQILWLAFKIAGVTFGSLLGVFLLGLLTTRRVADRANVVAMIVMALVNLALLTLSETKMLVFAWSWLVILGTIGT